tara:strand:+ start:3781 stop:4440 length:660 start_codon:yes stop_codon:yes gene_type:complete
MGKRWGVANDPKLLERIKAQELSKGTKALARNAHKQHPLSKPKQPSAAVLRAQKVARNNKDSRADSLEFSEDENTLTFVFAGAKLLGLNISLRMHDAKATEIKEVWLKRVADLVLMNRPIVKRWIERACYPIIIEEVYATTESSLLDSESVTASCKAVIDVFIKCGLIPDDSPKFVAQPIGYTYRQKPGGLIITFRPTANPWGAIGESTLLKAKSLSDS